MLSQFNTNVIFRILDAEEGKIISQRIGEIEYTRQQRNTSYGAHEHRDGESYTEQEKRRPLLGSSDFTKLKNLEGYVLMPDSNVMITKIQTAIASIPTKLEQFFVEK